MDKLIKPPKVDKAVLEASKITKKKAISNNEIIHKEVDKQTISDAYGKRNEEINKRGSLNIIK